MNDRRSGSSDPSSVVSILSFLTSPYIRAVGTVNIFKVVTKRKFSVINRHVVHWHGNQGSGTIYRSNISSSFLHIIFLSLFTRQQVADWIVLRDRWWDLLQQPLAKGSRSSLRCLKCLQGNRSWWNQWGGFRLRWQKQPLKWQQTGHWQSSWRALFRDFEGGWLTAILLKKWHSAISALRRDAWFFRQNTIGDGC